MPDATKYRNVCTICDRKDHQDFSSGAAAFDNLLVGWHRWQDCRGIIHVTCSKPCAAKVHEAWDNGTLSGAQDGAQKAELSHGHKDCPGLTMLASGTRPAE